MSAFEELVARHLRLHRELLELWRVTWPVAGGKLLPNEVSWLAERQGVLEAVAAHDGPGLAAESRAACEAEPEHPLAQRIIRLREGEVRIMEAILGVESRMRAVAEKHLRVMESELRSAERGRGAARRYRVVGQEARLLPYEAHAG